MSLKDYSTEDLKTELNARRAHERYERNKAKNPKRCETCDHFYAYTNSFNVMTCCDLHKDGRETEYDRKGCKEYVERPKDKSVWL